MGVAQARQGGEPLEMRFPWCLAPSFAFCGGSSGNGHFHFRLQSDSLFEVVCCCLLCGTSLQESFRRGWGREAACTP
eukprot:scaffold178221_cov32-Tisochrysis_lutea.AAC.6